MIDHTSPDLCPSTAYSSKALTLRCRCRVTLSTVPSEGLVRLARPIGWAHRALAWPTRAPAAPVVDGSHLLPPVACPDMRDLKPGHSNLKRPAPTLQHLWPADDKESPVTCLVTLCRAFPVTALALACQELEGCGPLVDISVRGRSGQRPILRVARVKNRLCASS